MHDARLCSRSLARQDLIAHQQSLAEHTKEVYDGKAPNRIENTADASTSFTSSALEAADAIAAFSTFLESKIALFNDFDVSLFDRCALSRQRGLTHSLTLLFFFLEAH